MYPKLFEMKTFANLFWMLQRYGFYRSQPWHPTASFRHIFNLKLSFLGLFINGGVYIFVIFSRLKKISLHTKNQLSSSKIDNFRAKKLYGQCADFRNTLPATVHCKGDEILW